MLKVRVEIYGFIIILRSNILNRVILLVVYVNDFILCEQYKIYEPFMNVVCGTNCEKLSRYFKCYIGEAFIDIFYIILFIII